MDSSRPEKKFEGMAVAVALSLVFLAFSFLRILGDATSASFGRGIFEVILAQSIWGTKLGDELMQFTLALLLIHVVFALACWGLARLVLAGFPDSPVSQRALTVI